MGTFAIQIAWRTTVAHCGMGAASCIIIVSMANALLLTKVYIPPPRLNLVPRPRLLERLNEGLSSDCKLTLLSAPAGFGKSTLVCDWLVSTKLPVAWVTLDERDKDPARFLTYLIAALQHIKPGIGLDLQAILQSPQPLQIENILTLLINQLSIIEENFLVILDDYHAIDSVQVDHLLEFLIDHKPSQMHLVITTREDPDLPLARLRGRGNCIELRASDLRFSDSETADFLNRTMKLHLFEKDILALQTRTEGWIAGLLMAALSLQGHPDAASFIQSFTGSHHFVLDYLIEEVLQQQSETIQTFLLRTSILDQLCGPLCDAVLGSPSASGQEIVEYLERANLFIVPLDNERRWYRYHHLFAELLRQRLHQSTSSRNEEGGVAALHIRASQWYEDNGLEIEAFNHAAAANDVERAARLIQGKGMPLHVRGAQVPVLNWLESLPMTVLDERPILWVMYAGALTTSGKTTLVEPKLKAAEAALQRVELNIDTRDILGRIANNRATLAYVQYQPGTAIAQALCALEYLHPDNLPVRNISSWVLGAAYQQKGDRTAASLAFTEAISISQKIGHTFVTKLATMGLGRAQETENKLYLAAETFRHALQLFGEYPLPSACEAYLGLARIYYEWNDLCTAEEYGQQSLRLAQQWDRTIDRFIVCEVFLARLKLARGDVAGAAAMLAVAEQTVRQNNFVHQISEVAAAQVIVLLLQGNLKVAAHLAQMHELTFSQARVYLAQGDASTALAMLVPLCQQMEAKGWQDELLRTKTLQALALQATGDKQKTLECLNEALQMAELGGFIRLFVDLGEPMRLLIGDYRLWLGKQPGDHNLSLREYVDKILAAFAPLEAGLGSTTKKQQSGLVEPLSERELEVLQLICQGLSNQEICQRLYLALDTVKGHNRRIFDKLLVHSRTEAIARAHELNLF